MNDIAHTGKSQASAQDIHSKIESQFLQRYAHYLIGDEFDTFLTPSFVHMLHILDSKKVSCEQLINYKTQQINNQNTESQVFFALRNFTFNSFSLMFDQKLENTNVYTKEDYFRSIRTTQDQTNRRHQFVHNPSNSFNQDKQEQQQNNFYELYSNKLAKDQGDILQGEIVIFDTRIKYPATKAKQLCYEIKQKIDNLFRSTTRQHQIIRSEYIPYLEEYKYPTIVLIILYNGDVNLDFSKLLQMNQITINRKQFALKVKVYFISKLSLFSHFREVNNQQKTECITDKVVTFYDMNRVRQKRQKVLKEIEIIKKQAQVNQNKKKKEQYWKWSITTGFCVAAAIYLLSKKQINLKKFVQYMQRYFQHQNNQAYLIHQRRLTEIKSRKSSLPKLDKTFDVYKQNRYISARKQEIYKWEGIMKQNKKLLHKLNQVESTFHKSVKLNKNIFVFKVIYTQCKFLQLQKIY
ncbi:unnamed protein product [Paramecium sonneborni]|uniref:Uncharacterized protein n=1 Tax=Paramecium sonneborni TaxID=65129 RepID=A0A8S1R6Q7_9CILI|nr:unnamed protein product [Paramecium sonneborni]